MISLHCAIFSLVFVKMWSLREDMLSISLVGDFICLNPKVLQNSKYFFRFRWDFISTFYYVLMMRLVFLRSYLRDKSETTHRRNIKILAAELFKIKNGLSNDIMSQLICKKNSVGCSLRSQTDFSLLRVKSVNYGLKVLWYFGPGKWNILPSDIKNSRTLREFSKKVKPWIPRNCPSWIWENFIYWVGFTNIQDSKKNVGFSIHILSKC